MTQLLVSCLTGYERLVKDCLGTITLLSIYQSVFIYVPYLDFDKDCNIYATIVFVKIIRNKK